MTCRGVRWRLFLSLPVLGALTTLAQTPPRLEFEAASVKRNATGDHASNLRSPNGRLTAINVIPMLLITSAYSVASFDISGAPAWLNTERYDVIAKASDGNATGQQTKLMLQSLLEGRFQLKVHRETREGAVLTLTVAKTGFKLQPLREGSCIVPDAASPPSRPSPGQKPPCGIIVPGSNGVNQTMSSAGMTVQTLARTLSLLLGRHIVDGTGIAGALDVFHLEFAPTRLDNAGGAASEAAGPTIYTALREQAGLKLESGRGPVEFLVIDHVEKPTDN
jgi:uncharacterized protein (TIGR03435 family)